MNEDVKKRWIEALRSGKYKQGSGTLQDGDGGFCCLGVLCDLYSSDNWEPHPHQDTIPYLGEEYYLPEEVMTWAGLPNADPCMRDAEASYWNDDEGLSFLEIADLVEKYL